MVMVTTSMLDYITEGNVVLMKSLRRFTNSWVLGLGMWRLLVPVVAGGMLLAVLPGGTVLASKRNAPLVYVTQRDFQPDAGAVAVIDTTTNNVVASVPVGPGANGMVVSSDAKRAYVANYGTFPSDFAQATTLSDTVSVLQLVPMPPHKNAHGRRGPRVVATVKVGSGPLGVAITPDDEEVYVTNFGQDSTLVPGGVEGNTVSVISTRRKKVVATVQVGNLPAGVAIRSDGQRAYVACRGNDEVWVLDTATHSVVAIVPVQRDPANVTLTPDGHRAYVTNFSSNSVSVIDTLTNTVLPVPDGEAITVGLVPIGLAVTPDGARVYVVNAFSNDVSVIDTTTNIRIETVAVGLGPRAVAITPDGAYAYVTNFSSDTISVISTATNTVVDTIAVAGGPNWVTMTK
jgi:YVTN family beta-propeller protein